MKASFIIHMVLLLLEGGLAWLTGGDAFLLIAVLCAVVVYGAFSAQNRLLGEGTRLLTAVAVAVAGPFKYQDSQIPVFLCFIALPHLLAATQALWEMRWGNRGASPQQAKTRGIVFTVAFYASLGLVFLLARGMEPYLSRAESGVLAAAVLMLCLPALDRSHIARLKPAPPGRDPAAGGLFRRIAAAAAVLGGLALLFSGPLASFSDLLVRLSPRWKMNPVDFRNRPPRQPGEGTPSPVPQTATRLGADNSARTGNHPLPQQSDIQQTGAPRLFIRPDNPADGPGLIDAGPLYVRTHTLNRFREQTWRAEVTGGGWVEDDADGARDGKVTLAPAAPGSVGHTVYVYSADGYTLPAIQGVTEFSFHRVYAVPGDIFQTTAAGDIFYHAVSRPLLFGSLPSAGLLESGDPGGKTHLDFGDGDDLARRLKTLAKTVFPENAGLSDKVTALKAHFAAHYTYSLRMTNPRGLPPLENFLFDERKGHCDFFSSAGALLLRAAGVPTRVAFGYAATTFDARTGTFPVLDRHAHSWTETYVAGHGWAICDFTPAPNIGQSSPSPESGVAPPDWDPNLFHEPPQEQRPEQKQAAVPEGPPQERRPFFSEIPLGEWMNSLLIALAGACLLYALFIGYRALKGKSLTKEEKEAAKERARREKQPAYFLELLRVCRAAGYPKDEAWTPLEFFSALRRNGPLAEDLRPLFVYHCQVRYEDAPEDDAAEKSFFGLIRSWDERRQAALAQAQAPG